MFLHVLCLELSACHGPRTLYERIRTLSIAVGSSSSPVPGNLCSGPQASSPNTCVTCDSSEAPSASRLSRVDVKLWRLVGVNYYSLFTSSADTSNISNIDVGRAVFQNTQILQHDHLREMKLNILSALDCPGRIPKGLRVSRSWCYCTMLLGSLLGRHLGTSTQVRCRPGKRPSPVDDPRLATSLVNDCMPTITNVRMRKARRACRRHSRYGIVEVIRRFVEAIRR